MFILGSRYILQHGLDTEGCGRGQDNACASLDYLMNDLEMDTHNPYLTRELCEYIQIISNMDLTILQEHMVSRYNFL